MLEPLHNLADTAKILGISEKTLMEHVQYGRIRSILLGAGKVRKHRRFTDKNITTFIEKQKHREVAPCPSTNIPEAPIGKSNSTSTVVPFGAVPKPATVKKHWQ